MSSFSFKKIDAFTSAQSSGNPAGVIYLDAPGQLSSEQMQRIAQECAGWVSEVGFVSGLEDSKLWMRYYSSEREVDFCGHATLAIAYDLFSSSERLRFLPEIAILTKNSELRAFNRVPAEDAVYISAPPAKYRECRVQPETCSKALRIGKGAGEPKAVINAGLETLIVEMSSLDAAISLKPDLVTLADFCVDQGVEIILVYTKEVATEGCAYRTRVFAPRFGYLEDPATGSGNAAFGYYLMQTGKWRDGVLAVEQNGSIRNPNLIRLSQSPEKGDDVRVRFGGRATVKISGEYFL